jgi:hypothetical protein
MGQLRVSHGVSGWISGWLNPVAAPVRERPDQNAGLGLVELPALSLFRPVMAAAKAGEVAFAGSAALVIRDRMVLVALDGRPAAARETARAVAHVDDVL